MQPGSIVRFRERDWVLLPSENDVIRLRPLTGDQDSEIGVHHGLSDLIAYNLATERISPSNFPLPTADHILDAASTRLLWQSARLMLREGATPFRSLGKISIRPRKYQFVPLMMALRLDPVRLLIADDVGIGKTIEALLIARELWDRGQIRRLAVLCPPALCDQWQQELTEKFNLPAEVLRSSTVSRLERKKPVNRSIFEWFPVQVISIDWVKTDRNRLSFIRSCPELVIVDEAHGAADSSGRNSAQQQRHRLVREIANDPSRHLLLLTATPHSGIDTAFQSLLGLLNPEFAQWEPGNLNEDQRGRLARHFINRARGDLLRGWQGADCFPKRECLEYSYPLSPAYRKLLDMTLDACSAALENIDTLTSKWQRKSRTWAALGLLRCVMSSPDAAQAALLNREHPGADAPDPESERPDEQEGAAEIPAFDATGEVDDEPAVRRMASVFQKNTLKSLRETAESLINLNQRYDQDLKLKACAEVVRELVTNGFHPIVWCHFVHTAEYVKKGLEHLLAPQIRELQIPWVTGRLSDEERREIVRDINPDRPRVLVATDCLSEGINLQEKFNAVLHYDLPWNPNRLEQREGRVDRYGQPARTVRAVLLYGQDNDVDGKLLEVLIRKSRAIRQAVGTHVPVPEESMGIAEVIARSVLLRQRPARQQELFLLDPDLQGAEERFKTQWDRSAEHLKQSRSLFAQHAVRADEVERELQTCDAVLGDPESTRHFLLDAAQRLGIPIPQADIPGVYLIKKPTETIPEILKSEIDRLPGALKRITFESPPPGEAVYVGRNHPLVSAAARWIFETALENPDRSVAARCGVIRTRSVTRLTTLLLLRARYLLQRDSTAGSLLAEEVLITGYRGPDAADPASWLSPDEARDLLETAEPSDNIPAGEKRELIQDALNRLGQPDTSPPSPVWNRFRDLLTERASLLRQSHDRVRKAIERQAPSWEVRPQWPPDVLSILMLQPGVQG